MRCAAALLPLLVAGCASGPTTSVTGATESCEVTDCFIEGDVRDFDIINRNTVVVYVGAQRCPFVVELGDVTCDVTVTPAIEFFQRALGSMDRVAPVQSGRVCASTRGLVLYAGVEAPSLLQQQEAVESRAGSRRPGGLSRSGGIDGSFPIDPASDDVCRVSDIRSITDDQLVELYAETNTPPPPVGEGRLEVPQDTEDEEDGQEDGRAGDDAVEADPEDTGGEE